RHDRRLVDRQRIGERHVAGGVARLPPPGVAAHEDDGRDDDKGDADEVVPARLEHLPRLRHRPGELVLFQLVTFSTFHFLPGGLAPGRTPLRRRSRGPLPPAPPGRARLRRARENPRVFRGGFAPPAPPAPSLAGPPAPRSAPAGALSARW